MSTTGHHTQTQDMGNEKSLVAEAKFTRHLRRISCNSTGSIRFPDAQTYQPKKNLNHTKCESEFPHQDDHNIDHQ